MFDLIVIGSGPAAVATLTQVPQGLRCVMVTGAVRCSSTDPRFVHAKIRLVATQIGEGIGLSDPLPVRPAGAPLHSTSIIGGLANYWGQQFLEYEPKDPLPEAFEDYEDYQKYRREIENLFCCTPSSPDQAGEGFHMRLPRLLIGTRANPSAGLSSMRRALDLLCASKEVRLLDATAIRIGMERGQPHVVLHDGTTLHARKVILAAGVIGSSRLVMQSFSEHEGINFKDHTPTMLYVLDPKMRFGVVRADGIRNFNAQTIERIEDGTVSLFSSVYRLSNASVGLLLAKFGLPAWAASMPLPKIMNLIKPVQVWTSDTIGDVYLEKDGMSARTSAPGQPAAADLSRLKALLECEGAILLTAQATKPGQGFHYFGAKVAVKSGCHEDLSEFLSGRTNGTVICVDASAMTRIGCRPHTLTAMAMAAKMTAIQLRQWMQ